MGCAQLSTYQQGGRAWRTRESTSGRLRSRHRSGKATRCGLLARCCVFRDGRKPLDGRTQWQDTMVEPFDWLRRLVSAGERVIGVAALTVRHSGSRSGWRRLLFPSRLLAEIQIRGPRSTGGGARSACLSLIGWCFPCTIVVAMSHVCGWLSPCCADTSLSVSTLCRHVYPADDPTSCMSARWASLTTRRTLGARG